MALEPLLPELDETEHPELMDFRRRFWWTLPLTVVTVVLAMFGHRFGWMQASTQSWVELVLSTPVVVWAGWPFFQRCFQSFLRIYSMADTGAARRRIRPTTRWMDSATTNRESPAGLQPRVGAQYPICPLLQPARASRALAAD